MGKNYNMSLFDQLKNRIIGKLLLKMNKTFRDVLLQEINQLWCNHDAAPAVMFQCLLPFLIPC